MKYIKLSLISTLLLPSISFALEKDVDHFAKLDDNGKVKEHLLVDKKTGKLDTHVVLDDKGNLKHSLKFDKKGNLMHVTLYNKGGLGKDFKGHDVGITDMNKGGPKMELMNNDRVGFNDMGGKDGPNRFIGIPRHR